MSDTAYKGRCFCGSVTFKVDGPAKSVCFCHCESCRRSTGGAYVPWATFSKDTFVISGGQMAEYHSTPKVTRGLCSICGTSLSYEHADRPGQIDITLTSLDDASGFSPSAHIWVADKLPWLVIDDDLPQYAQWADSD